MAGLSSGDCSTAIMEDGMDGWFGWMVLVGLLGLLHTYLHRSSWSLISLLLPIHLPLINAPGPSIHIIVLPLYSQPMVMCVDSNGHYPPIITYIYSVYSVHTYILR